MTLRFKPQSYFSHKSALIKFQRASLCTSFLQSFGSCQRECSSVLHLLSALPIQPVTPGVQAGGFTVKGVILPHRNHDPPLCSENKEKMD